MLECFRSSTIRPKLKAFTTHLLLTVVVAILGALVVFFIWYPKSLSLMLGAVGIYKLIVGVELVLGPIMSLVIYSPNKSRYKLTRDYALVGCVQVAALLYGLGVMAQARPVYLIFVKDRIEI